jgi:hypothetical protein
MKEFVKLFVRTFVGLFYFKNIFMSYLILKIFTRYFSVIFSFPTNWTIQSLSSDQMLHHPLIAL